MLRESHTHTQTCTMVYRVPNALCLLFKMSWYPQLVFLMPEAGVSHVFPGKEWAAVAGCLQCWIAGLLEIIWLLEESWWALLSPWLLFRCFFCSKCSGDYRVKVQMILSGCVLWTAVVAIVCLTFWCDGVLLCYYGCLFSLIFILVFGFFGVVE